MCHTAYISILKMKPDESLELTFNLWLHTPKQTCHISTIFVANLKESCLELKPFSELFIKGGCNSWSQSSNNVLLLQHDKFTVGVSQKKMGRETRVMTDLCEKQIKMLVSNYWPSACFRELTSCWKRLPAVSVSGHLCKSQLKCPHLSLSAKWKRSDCITFAMLFHYSGTIFTSSKIDHKHHTAKRLKHKGKTI